MRNSSPICVDASLVVRLVSVQVDEAVQRLWDRWHRDRREFVAPLLLRYEVTNALHRLRHAGAASDGATDEALRAALAIPIRLDTNEALHATALAFAGRFSLPAAYDAHYLALADRRGVEFWTTDLKLTHAIGSTLPWVRLGEG